MSRLKVNAYAWLLLTWGRVSRRASSTMGPVSTLPLTIRVRRNRAEVWAGDILSVAELTMMTGALLQEKRGYSGTMYLNSTHYPGHQYIRCPWSFCVRGSNLKGRESC